MRYFRLRPGLTAWLLFFSAIAFLACDATLAATQYVVIQPIDVCQTTGFVKSQVNPPSCASYNSTDGLFNPDPSTANSSTTIGFVDQPPPTGTGTNINITRDVWLQSGIDVTFLPLVQYNNTTYQNIMVTCTDSSCTTLTSSQFKTLSSGAATAASGCTSHCTDPVGANAPVPSANAINMFFVNALVPIPPVVGPLFGFAWLNGDGIAVSNLTFLSSRIDTLPHEIGHNLGLDHTTFGAGDPSNCPMSYNGSSDAGCNVMDAGSFPRVTPTNTTNTSSTGALTELMFKAADQLVLGNGNNTQQGQALLSGFMNPIPNVSAMAGGGAAAPTIATTTTTTATASTSGPIPFTVTYPRLKDAGGRKGQFIFALILALPEEFEFDTPGIFTQTGGNAQVFSFGKVNGNNGANSNCIKPLNGVPAVECLEIDFVVNPNPTPPSTCPADPATCYNGTFTANTSISFTSAIRFKGGPTATISDLAAKCVATASEATPLQCLDLAYVFSDLLATSTAFGAPVNGVSTGNSQLPDEAVPSTIVDPANFPSVASLNPPLKLTGFTQTPCTSTTTSCPPLAGGNPGND